MNCAMILLSAPNNKCRYIELAHGLTLGGIVCEYIKDVSGKIYLLSVLRTEWASNANGQGGAAGGGVQADEDEGDVANMPEDAGFEYLVDDGSRSPSRPGSPVTFALPPHSPPRGGNNNGLGGPEAEGSSAVLFGSPGSTLRGGGSGGPPSRPGTAPLTPTQLSGGGGQPPLPRGGAQALAAPNGFPRGTSLSQAGSPRAAPTPSARSQSARSLQSPSAANGARPLSSPLHRGSGGPGGGLPPSGPHGSPLPGGAGGRPGWIPSRAPRGSIVPNSPTSERGGGPVVSPLTASGAHVNDGPRGAPLLIQVWIFYI